MSTHNTSRRNFIKTVGYVTPVILTMKAIPSYASSGSGYKGGQGGSGGGSNGHGGNHNGGGPRGRRNN
jgi:hypothetical protein